MLLRAYQGIIDRRLAPDYLAKKGVVFNPQTLKCYGLPYVSRGTNSKIVFGQNAQIYSRERSNPLALDHASTFIVYDNAEIIIGDNFSCSGAIIIAKTKVTIGDHVMIGANTRIYDTDFHPTDPVLRREHPTRGAKSLPVQIGSDVFIGCHVHVLKGVTVADNSVIPAGTIVWEDFPKTKKNS